MSNCTLESEGLQPPTSRFYSYDPASNRTSKTVVESGVVTSSELLDSEDWDPENRFNSLNQIERRDVTDADGTTTWRYTFDDDGNMTGKSNGDAISWVYEFDR